MKKVDEKELEEHQQRLELLRARIYAAKTAYMNRTPFEDMAEVTFEDLKGIAQEFIKASYDYQKLKYGSVKLRISISKLLRR